MIKVAVITRTKDRPIFLRRAIESVSSQSYTEYTHVIVNDGGDPADIEKVLKSFSSEVNAKINLFHREKPSEAPDTIFNESIDRITSKYFAIHDDDDTWHKDFLKNTVAHLEANKDLGGVVVRTEKILERVGDGGIEHISSRPWMPDLRVVSLYRQCIDNQLTPIAVLLRRSAYEDVGKFDESLPVVGDWEFGVRLLQKYDIDFFDAGYPLAYYHHRQYQAGSQGNTSFAGNDKHRYYTNLVMNRYLRSEIAKGELGVGYIMSQLKYQQGQMGRLAGSILPGFITNRLKKRF